MKKVQFANKCSKNKGKRELNKWFDEESVSDSWFIKNKYHQHGLLSIKEIFEKLIFNMLKKRKENV